MKYIFAYLLITCCFGAFAQTPEWQINPNDFEYSMTFTGIATINQEENTNTGSKVAAWVGNELRGTADPIYVEATGRYYYQLLVYANTIGETVTFSFYNADNNQIIELSNIEAFVPDNNSGSFSNPYAFRNWENTTFNSFSFVGFNSEADINPTTNTITITLPDNTDKTNLVAQYQFDHATSVQVDGLEQETGVTANDFTGQVKYVVNTGSNIYTWTVIVYVENSTYLGVDNEFNEEYTVYPNPAKEILNIKSADKIKEFEILNASGNVVLKGNESSSIEVGSLSPGAYLIRIHSDNNIPVTMKWLKY
ncbi:T9SS type A sorting domain-containing protein [Marinigracilibium pacificum]|uniref:T9SS type A sorting domain-containing protein n=1 Tax=Marinigracilibium pacificum TaxID=2729599 RepID=A0A848J4U9_9BACT|nr:T9SS type A sorting domain-containing protein [Marinigracilibium pacificum]NMM49540.1 T9SS type A sorting domain-containing protein [Marinigracilibium pacificum]